MSGHDGEKPVAKIRRGSAAPSTISVAEISDAGQILDEHLQTGEVDTSVSPELSAGDVDARWDQAESSGEETAGGSAPTPDQNVVEEFGKAVGVTYEEEEPLSVGRKEEQRDEHRWELDPASADDYGQRSNAAAADRVPILKMRHRDRYADETKG
jgi:hypothetical protein